MLSCARRPFDRYVIESDEHPLDIEADVLTDAADVEAPVEWVLLSVKAHQTAGAADWLARLCGDGTKVLVVQNGIEHDHADRYTNGAPTIPTVVYCGAELIEPGRIRHSSAGYLIVPNEPYGDDLLALFADSKAEVRPSEDFATHQWRKLSLNIMVNGLTALTRRRMGVIAEPGIRRMAITLLEECWHLAVEADDADLDPAGAGKLVDALIGSGNDGGTSMLYDTLAGRPTEHDAIHGAALRRADALGIDVPTIRIVHDLLDARAPAPD